MTPFTCWLCQRTIGRGAEHYALDGGDSAEVVCARCTHGRARGVVTRLGTRAQAAHVLLGITSDQDGARR